MTQANVTHDFLQIHRMRALPSGLTESNHLSSAYLTEPEKMDSVIAYAMGTTQDTVLQLLTGGIGNVKVVSNREYTWDLHGMNTRVTEAIVGAYDTPAATPGIGGTEFKVITADRLFEIADVVVCDDGETELRVMTDPAPEQGGWLYVFRSISGELGSYVSPVQVQTGARFSKRYAIVEEFSLRGGSTDFQAPMKLINQLTTLRKQYAVTRSAATDVMVVDVMAEDGQKTRYWTKLAEWTAIAQWYKEKDRAMLYNKYNKSIQGYTDLKGENGRPIYIGAGLRQQISPANVRYYSRLTYELLENFLIDLSYSANRWGGNHKFVALTGKMGMREFNRVIQEKISVLPQALTNGASFISGSGMNMTFGGGFTTVKFLNGIELTVKEFPIYDDIYENRTLHPVSLKPLESYRFTLLNFGTTAKGKGNIRKVIKRNSDNAMWYVAGSVDPMGNLAKSTSVMRSSGIDGYHVHFLTEEGIQLEDPTSCGELIMRLN